MHTIAARKYLLAHAKAPFAGKPRHEGKDGMQVLPLHETGLGWGAHPELWGRKHSQAPEGQHGLLYTIKNVAVWIYKYQEKNPNNPQNFTIPEWRQT